MRRLHNLAGLMQSACRMLDIPEADGVATQCQANSCYSLYKELVPYKRISPNMCTYTYQQL